MIIDRYLTYQILRPFTIGVGLLVVVFVGYSLSVQLGKLEGGVVQPMTAAMLVVFNTVVALEILLPTALYLAILSAIGRLYKESEMAALQAVGVSELRVMGTVMKLAVVITLMVALISLFGRPWAYRESYRLEFKEAADFSVLKIEPGQFIELNSGGVDGYVLFARDVDRDRARLKEVFLQRKATHSTEVIVAKEAQFFSSSPESEQRMVFYDGYSYTLNDQGVPQARLHYGELIVNLAELDTQSSYRRKAQPTFQLRHSTARKDIAEYQGRLSVPVATIMLALLAVPLSRAGPRHSRSTLFFTAIVVYVLFFSALMMTKNWIEKGRMDPVPGMWLAHVLPLGLLMAWFSTYGWRRYRGWQARRAARHLAIGDAV